MCVINATKRASTGTEAKMAIGIARAAAVDDADIAQHREGGEAEQEAGAEVHGLLVSAHREPVLWGTVMAGLVPAIHVVPTISKDVDARAFAAPKRLRPRRRDEPGHDDRRQKPNRPPAGCADGRLGAIRTLGACA